MTVTIPGTCPSGSGPIIRHGSLAALNGPIPGGSLAPANTAVRPFSILAKRAPGAHPPKVAAAALPVIVTPTFQCEEI